MTTSCSAPTGRRPLCPGFPEVGEAGSTLGLTVRPEAHFGVFATLFVRFGHRWIDNGVHLRESGRQANGRGVAVVPPRALYGSRVAGRRGLDGHAFAVRAFRPCLSDRRGETVGAQGVGDGAERTSSNRRQHTVHDAPTIVTASTTASPERGASAQWRAGVPPLVSASGPVARLVAG